MNFSLFNPEGKKAYEKLLLSLHFRKNKMSLERLSNKLKAEADFGLEGSLLPFTSSSPRKADKHLQDLCYISQ